MYAVFVTGGKQYRVQANDEIYVEKLDGEQGNKITFDEVLAVDGKIGQPLVAGATVEAEIVKNGKAKKIIVFKFQSKKDHKKKQGHRQPYTKLKITAIKG